MPLDAIERAILAACAPTKTPSYDNLTGGLSFKHLACPHCGHHRSDRVELEGGREGERCKRCGIVSNRFVMKSVQGARASETRTRMIRDMLTDGSVDYSMLKRLSRESREWLEWAHTALYSGDRKKAKTARQNIQWNLFLAIFPQVKLTKSENPAAFSARLIFLCEEIAKGRRPGMSMASNSEISRVLRLSPSSLTGGRRWSSVLTIANVVISEWEGEIISPSGA